MKQLKWLCLVLWYMLKLVFGVVFLCRVVGLQQVPFKMVKFEFKSRKFEETMIRIRFSISSLTENWIILVLTIVLVEYDSCFKWNSDLITFVIPGKSTNVRLRTCGLNIFKLIGSGEIPLFLPVSLSVSLWISSLISLKSKYFSFGLCKNSNLNFKIRFWPWQTYLPILDHHSMLRQSHHLSQILATFENTKKQRQIPFVSIWVSCKINGLLVTIPDPLGRKSLPTMCSKTEDLPLLWLPTTTIYIKKLISVFANTRIVRTCGKSITLDPPSMTLKTSCNLQIKSQQSLPNVFPYLLTTGISCSIIFESWFDMKD